MPTRKNESRLQEALDNLGTCHYVGLATAVIGFAGAVASSDKGGGGGSSGGGGGGSSGGDATNLYNSEANIANRLDQRSAAVFEPLQDKIVADATQAGSDAQIADAMGKANADTQTAADAARRGTMEALRTRGVNLTSGAATGTTGDLALNTAIAGGAAQTAARDNAIATGRALKVQAAGLGAGLDQTAAAGYGAAATGLQKQQQIGYAQNQNNLANQGYGVANIAKGLGTASSKWFAPNGLDANGYANGSYSPNTVQNTGYSDASAYSGYGDYTTGFKAGGIPSAMSARRGVRRKGVGYAGGGVPATGGVVVGPGGPTDDAVPATANGTNIDLSNGEGVLNQPATDQILGKPLVSIINALGVVRRTMDNIIAGGGQTGAPAGAGA